MEFVQQTIESILENLGELKVDWQDDNAKYVIKYLEQMTIKNRYSERDIKDI